MAEEPQEWREWHEPEHQTQVQLASSKSSGAHLVQQEELHLVLVQGLEALQVQLQHVQLELLDSQLEQKSAACP